MNFAIFSRTFCFFFHFPCVFYYWKIGQLFSRFSRFSRMRGDPGDSTSSTLSQDFYKMTNVQTCEWLSPCVPLGSITILSLSHTHTHTTTHTAGDFYAGFSLQRHKEGDPSDTCGYAWIRPETTLVRECVSGR